MRKGEIACLQAISPFLSMFSTAIYLKGGYFDFSHLTELKKYTYH